MKRGFVILGIILGIILYLAAPLRASAGQADDAQFFSSMQDLPLMPGLVELPGQTVMFDKPEGRIIESIAEIETGSEKAVRHYYESTLPQLGWQRAADSSYIRQAEQLQLSFEHYNGQNFLRIMVTPR